MAEWRQNNDASTQKIEMKSFWWSSKEFVPQNIVSAEKVDLLRWWLSSCLHFHAIVFHFNNFRSKFWGMENFHQQSIKFESIWRSLRSGLNTVNSVHWTHTNFIKFVFIKLPFRTITSNTLLCRAPLRPRSKNWLIKRMKICVALNRYGQLILLHRVDRFKITRSNHHCIYFGRNETI